MSKKRAVEKQWHIIWKDGSESFWPFAFWPLEIIQELTQASKYEVVP